MLTDPCEVKIGLSSVEKVAAQMFDLEEAVSLSAGVDDRRDEGEKDEITDELSDGRPHLPLLESLLSSIDKLMLAECDLRGVGSRCVQCILEQIDAGRDECVEDTDLSRVKILFVCSEMQIFCIIDELVLLLVVFAELTTETSKDHS